MLAWILDGKSISNENAIGMLCSECPCKLDFEVCASSHCGCFSGGIDMGMLKGEYRITYMKGATRTRYDYRWNESQQGSCYGNCDQPCFAIFLGGKLCPGYRQPGFSTFQEAENYGKGQSQTMSFDGTRTIYLRYSDDLCYDSEGCITYRIVRISSTTETEKQIAQLPKELQ